MSKVGIVKLRSWVGHVHLNHHKGVVLLHLQREVWRCCLGHLTVLEAHLLHLAVEVSHLWRAWTIHPAIGLVGVHPWVIHEGKWVHPWWVIRRGSGLGVGSHHVRALVSGVIRAICLVGKNLRLAMSRLLFHLAHGILILVNLPFLLEVQALESLIVDDRVALRSLDWCLEVTELGKSQWIHWASFDCFPGTELFRVTCQCADWRLLVRAPKSVVSSWTKWPVVQARVLLPIEDGT